MISQHQLTITRLTRAVIMIKTIAMTKMVTMTQQIPITVNSKMLK